MTSWLMYQGAISELFLVFIYLPSCIVFLYFIKRKQLKVGVRRSVILVTRIVLALVLFVSMTWKPILTKHYFDAYCEADGGSYVSSSQRVDSIFLEVQPHEIAAKHLLNRGLDFVESNNDGNGVIRQRLNKNGEIELEYADESKSGFEFVYLTSERVEPSFIDIYRSMTYVHNRYTGSIIGGYTNYLFFPRSWSWLNITGVVGNIECSELPRFKGQSRYSDTTDYLDLITAKR